MITGSYYKDCIPELFFNKNFDKKFKFFTQKIPLCDWNNTIFVIGNMNRFETKNLLLSRILSLPPFLVLDACGGYKNSSFNLLFITFFIDTNFFIIYALFPKAFRAFLRLSFCFERATGWQNRRHLIRVRILQILFWRGILRVGVQQLGIRVL